MPHCIIEYSADLNDRVNEIISAVHSGAVSSNLFNANDINARAIVYKDFKFGDVNASFIHVSSKILSGRDSAQKLTLNSAIVNQIKMLDLSNCKVTAEVMDIHRDSHASL